MSSGKIQLGYLLEWLKSYQNTKTFFTEFIYSKTPFRRLQTKTPNTALNSRQKNEIKRNQLIEDGGLNLYTQTCALRFSPSKKRRDIASLKRQKAKATQKK